VTDCKLGKRDVMRRAEILGRSLYLVLWTAVVWLAVYGVAWAQEAGGASASPRDFLLPYALVFLAIILGLLIVCSPSRRRERERPEQYEGSSLTRVMGEEGAGGPAGGGVVHGAPGYVPGRVTGIAPPGFAAQGPAPLQAGSVHCQEATNALIVAIVGFFICTPILGPIALSMAIKARNMIRQDPRLSGEGTALAALILGGLETGVTVLLVLFLLIGLLGGLASQ
jgi:hypothetical protein